MRNSRSMAPQDGLTPEGCQGAARGSRRLTSPGAWARVGRGARPHRAARDARGATMRLGLALGYTGARVHVDVQAVQEAERLGYHSVWTAEAYGSDAVVPLAWLGALTYRIRLGTAILQMAARTPAMTAMTLDALSGGRVLLGLGVSGPQVVEGWHGQPFGKPLGRTREYVSIVRAIFARESPLEFTGEHYQIPYRGPEATGLGKPLRSIVHGRPDLPIYLAAIGPKNVALAAEIADGWIPVYFSPFRVKMFQE